MDSSILFIGIYILTYVAILSYSHTTYKLSGNNIESIGLWNK